ncbi:MAG: LacI family DNA-binding transcriptional regulator [Pseudomonadota bacterium]
MGERKIRNMEEFAALSGISRPTVSKYFNDPDSVRKSTRARIEAALARYEYRPNIYAMNQNRRLTKTVGIVVPYLADPFFAEIARNIERMIIDAGFSPILFSAHGAPSFEVEILDTLRSLKPAGVLLAPLGRASDRAVVEKFCADVPTVLFDSNIADLGEAFIGSDNDQSIALIVEYLCRSGTPPRFFEMATPTNPNANRRRAAYLRVMAALGHTPHCIKVPGSGWDFEEIGFREGLRLFQDGSITAGTILCSNDRLAIGLLAAAFEHGLPVGRADSCPLRIAGHDDHPFARFTCPSLTTVAQDYASIAERSVETLFARIESGASGAVRATTLFAGRLVERASA